MFSSQFYENPDKQSLLKHFLGCDVQNLPTPSFLVDRAKFSANSAKMLEGASRLHAEFRCHVKTHKALEGVRLQLGTGPLKTDKIVVSTLAEAWSLIPLVEEGILKDVLFGVPVIQLRIPELAAFSEKVKLNLMVDHAAQIEALRGYSLQHGTKWNIFVKIDLGTGRAGMGNTSAQLSSLLATLLGPECSKYISLTGFYCHAGHSYGSKSGNEAKTILLEEIRHANAAAVSALKIRPGLKLHLSVGATPTAHISQQITIEEIEKEIGNKLLGTLELHAGNYPCCDLQQVATGLVDEENVSVSLLAEIVSEYPGRGNPPGEQLINAGVVALSRELGPFPGFGKVVSKYGNWVVGKLSQEHGILTALDDTCKFIPYGTKVKILPQHSCITAANHGWYFVVEDGKVVDVWVPTKLW